MKVTGLVLWAQDNTLAVRFYKKLGFDVVSSDEQTSVVRLNDFEISLVTMRDEVEFNRDSLSSGKGRGIYLYVRVDDVDALYGSLPAKGVTPYSASRDRPWGNREFIIKELKTPTAISSASGRKVSSYPLL